MRDPALRMELDRSFHQEGTVKENVLVSDFVPLCDGTMIHRSFTNIRLLEWRGCRRISAGEIACRRCEGFGSCEEW